MSGPRATRRGELRGLSELADRVFLSGKDGERSMFDRFPTLFADENLGNCRVFCDGPRPVSHVGYVARDAVLSGAVIRIACVGAVCTDEAYRGRRLATRLLDDCERRMRRQRVDIIYISGGRSLYRRRGARTVGRHVRYTLDRKTAARLRNSSLTVKPAGLRQASILARLYNELPVRHVRPAEDWRRFLRSGICANCAALPYVAYAGRRPVAYVVHQHTRPTLSPTSRVAGWAGDPRAVLATLAAIPTLGNRRNVEVVVDERADSPLALALDDAGVPAVAAAGGRTVIVLRPATLFRKLRPHLPPAARDLFLEDGRDGTRFRQGRNVLRVPREMLARVLFGSPENDVDAFLDGAGPVADRIRSAFPVALPPYGYNYI